MASVEQNSWGLVITLTHEDVQRLKPDWPAVAAPLAGSTGLIARRLALTGVAAPLATAISAAIVTAIAAEIPAISRADRGHGLALTIPWTTVFAGLPTVIPTPPAQRVPSP